MKIRKRVALLLVIVFSVFLLKGVSYYYLQKNRIMYANVIKDETVQIDGLTKNTNVPRNYVDTSGHKEIFGFLGMYIIIARLSNLKSKLIIRKKNKNIKKVLKNLRKQDNTYLEENLDERIKASYFKVEEAWSRMELNLAKDYMSDNLYKMHSTKTEWMKIRREKYIVQNIKLIGIKIIGLQHYKDNSKDIVWCCIKCSMTNYIISDFTEKVMNANSKVKNKKIIEFWKFNKKDGVWVLDEIIKIKDKDKWRDIGVFIE